MKFYFRHVLDVWLNLPVGRRRCSIDISLDIDIMLYSDVNILTNKKKNFFLGGGGRVGNELKLNYLRPCFFLLLVCLKITEIH